MNQESEVYLPEEVIAKFRVSKAWLNKYTQARRVPGQIQFGKAWRYRKTEVDAAFSTRQFLVPEGGVP
jgi:hypothetical protein